jgi:DNA-binding LacI/PurR family transcriptional regulator
MATIKDVAKKAGVSASTVSYALNGTRPISDATRQRIMAAIQRAAKAMTTNTASTAEEVSRA